MGHYQKTSGVGILPSRVAPLDCTVNVLHLLPATKNSACDGKQQEMLPGMGRHQRIRTESRLTNDAF